MFRNTVRIMARGSERYWAGLPGLHWLLCPLLVEIIARLAASIISSATRYGHFAVERRIRGFLHASRFRAVGLQIDRRLQIESPDRLILGDRVTLYGGSHFVAGGNGKIRIGRDSHIGRNCVLSGLGGIQVGNGCAISSAVCIYSVSNKIGDDPTCPILECTEHRQVVIGDDVWIGAGATLLPGVEIGHHAVIGAGAVVHRNVPAWQVVGGVPARAIKDRRDVSKSSPAKAA